MLELRVCREGVLSQGIGWIEQIAIVDLILTESIEPARRGDLQRRIADHDKINDAQTIAKNMQSRRNGFGGLGGIEVIDSTGIEVTAGQGEKLDGQKPSAVVAPEISAVADDGVVMSVRMGDEPAAAVIDVNVHLRVLEERAHDRVLRDQLEIARIDLHHGELN